MKIRKLTDNKPKILIFQGSPRREDSCANQTSKTERLIKYIYDKWSPFAKIEIIDLSVGDVVIQPCKGCVSTANGMHCHWKCVAEDQRVHTKDGFVMIRDIKVGDILQDGNKVLNHVLTSNSEEIFEVKLQDGRRVELTQDHKVKVLSKERYRDSKSNWSFFRKEEWIEVKNLNINDIIPTPDLDDSFFLSSKEMDLDYLLFGLIWGDGTFANDTALLYVDKKEESFLSELRKKIGSKIVSELPDKIDNSKKLNENYKEYTTEILKLNFGAEFGRKMKEIGFLKKEAKVRRLPIDSFYGDSIKIFSFLNGWISTDGCVHKKGISIYNTSYDCLRDLQLLLTRLNIRSSISDVRNLVCEVRGKNKQRCSSLNISGYDSVNIIYQNMKLLHPDKQQKLENYISSLRKKMKSKPSKIKSVKSIGFKPVYDIEVENSHEFNCEGIKIHNCSCYSLNSETKPDLMYEAFIYDRLEKCDGFLVVSPIHWHSVSTQVKAMFDRLVCANQTITQEEALEIFGEGNTKNSKLTGRAELSKKYRHLLKNHLEGKWASFIVHGDNGANDYEGQTPPWTNESMWNIMNSVMPLVYQCRYSGINCPDDLVEAVYINEGIPYYQANKSPLDELQEIGDRIFDKLLNYLNDKNPSI